MSEYVFNYSQYENKYVFDSKKYKSSITSKNNFHFSIMFFVIIILLGACVFLQPKQTEMLEFYFIEIDKFQTYQNALNLSQEINSVGGAGYIYFDGKYHVLASFYSDYDNAETVLESLKNDYPSSNILTISTKPYSLKSNLKSIQNSAVENVINKSEDLVIQVEQLSNKYDRDEVTLSSLQLQLKNLYDDFHSSYDNFMTQFKTNSKYNVAKDHLSKMQKSISTLSNESGLTTANLRYELVSFVINRCQFLSCF